MGYKSVADAASVARTIAAGIRSGRRRRIRRDTEARILAVTAEAYADGARVPAGPTWRLLDELIGRGYTRGQIALWLGCKTPALQIKRGGKILAATAARVRKVYGAIEAGRLRRT